MRELFFVIDTLAGLVVGAFLLRLILQWARADFRNPLAQAITRLTNPLVMPLRKVLPPIGKLDTASVAAVLLVQLARLALKYFLLFGALPGVLTLLVEGVLDLADTVLLLYLVLLFAWVVMSWVNQDPYNPAAALLRQLVSPLLRPFQRAIPLIGGLDLSPLFLGLTIQVLRMLLQRLHS
jgi:YggT family protein